MKNGIFANKDAALLGCIDRGSDEFITEDGKVEDGFGVQLCKSCKYEVNLDPAKFYPSSFLEVVCSGKSDCLFHEGTCCQRNTNFPFQKYNTDTKEWETYTQSIRTGCECRLSKASPLITYAKY